MVNEVVKYHNDMNTIAFRKFSTEEFNLFFAMCHKVKEKGVTSLQYTFDEIRGISGYNSRDNIRLAKNLASTYEKMLTLTFGKNNGLNVERFVLFTDYKVDYDNQLLTVGVHKRWEYILNQLNSDFTRFELQEFSQIRSTYAKTMYRLLKQFRQTGYVYIEINEFRRVLEIPKSYRMSEIDKWVFTPITNELTPLFKNLKIKKVRAKKGNKVSALEFIFLKEAILSYNGVFDSEKTLRTDEVVEGQISLDGYYNWIDPEKEI